MILSVDILNFKKILTLKCERCGHTWISKRTEQTLPKECVKCKNTSWNVPRKINTPEIQPQPASIETVIIPEVVVNSESQNAEQTT